MNYLSANTNNGLNLSNPISSILGCLPSALAAPFNNYFIIKSQKEVLLRKVDNNHKVQMYVLSIYDHLASTNQLTEKARSDLMNIYSQTLL